MLYDTSCFARHDVVELFARVPAERIVFGSDAPYGQPTEGLFLAMRAAAYAGLDADDRALVAGGTMTAVLDGNPPPSPTPPRLQRVRPFAGSLDRVATYLMMGFSAVLSAPPPRPSRALSWLELARGLCRDADPRFPASFTAWQPVRELGPRSGAELPEYLAQVVFHRAGADEQLLGDLTVGRTARGQVRDAGFLGSEVEFGLRSSRSGPLAGSAQFIARLFGEADCAHGVEHVLGDAKLAARVAPSSGASQPLAVQQVPPG